MSLRLKIPSSKARVLLGSPGWYAWQQARIAAGVLPKAKFLTLLQFKIILGWLSLRERNTLNRSVEACLIEYARAASRGQPQIPPIMEAKSLLDLAERPSKSTLYRRGFRSKSAYSSSQIQTLLMRRKKNGKKKK